MLIKVPDQPNPPSRGDWCFSLRVFDRFMPFWAWFLGGGTVTQHVRRIFHHDCKHKGPLGQEDVRIFSVGHVTGEPSLTIENDTR